MKAPVDWLRELLPDVKSSPKTLSDLLTFSGTEVEAIEKSEAGPVLVCAVTSNRPDCLGVMGLARDFAAVTRKTLVPPSCDVPTAAPATAERATVRVDDAAFCPRYVGVVVEGIRVGPSPDHVRRRLESMGARSVNNVVDATNLVLFERSQPLHAFDLDKLAGGGVVVRRAKDGEKMAALDGREYTLNATMGVIADAAGPVAIAGVMGGERTAVDASTTRILLESACFDPPSVRRTSRALALKSDSSHRFERGVDREGALDGALRAARIIVELAGGTVRTAPIDVRTAPVPTPAIRLSRRVVKSVTGASIPASRIERLLTDLGCTVARVDDDAFDVTPPSWRADLVRGIDLVEEIIRVVGLDKIPEGGGLRVIPVRLHPERTLIDAVKSRLALIGLDECVTPTFVREGRDASLAFLGTGAGLVVRNPVRAGEGAVRRSLLPSLLAVCGLNRDQGNTGLRLFECGNLAFDGGDAVPDRVPAVAALLETGFRETKGVLEALVAGLGTAITFGTSGHDGLDPLVRQSVLLDGRAVGVIGRVAKDLADERHLDPTPHFFELDLRPFVTAWRPVKTFVGLPKFPATVRDLAFVLDDGVSYAALVATLRAAAGPDLEDVRFFDEFRGRQVGDGKKSLAVSVVFRSASGTLSGEDVDARCRAVVDAVAAAHGGRLR